MSFKDRILQARESERLNSIKLEENITYNTKIISASYGKQNKTNYDCVTITLECIDPQVVGKQMKKVYVIDANTKNPLQGNIGLSQLINLMEHFNLPFEDEKTLVVNLLELKNKTLQVTIEKVVDKNDNSKTYNNVKIVF